MARKEYSYTSRYHRNSRQFFYRPLIDVEVSADSGPEMFSALIDSGTELTIMSAEIAQLVGISAANKTRAVASGFGDKEGFVAQVNIIVPEFPSVRVTTNVLFVDGVSGDFPFDILLGQEDFFRQFLITFEKRKNRFFLGVSR